LVGPRFAPLALERAEPFCEPALLRRDAADFEPFGAREERDEALRGDAPPPWPEDPFALGLEPDPFADPFLCCAL
jgi:hypothetical protein